MKKKNCCLPALCMSFILCTHFAFSQDVNQWGLQISVASPTLGVTDEQNLAGVSYGASDGLDIYDICTQPPGSVPLPVRLSFPHPEFEGLEDGVTGVCQQDVRSPVVSSKVWNLQLNVLEPDAEIVFTWDLNVPFLAFPDEYDAILTDDETSEKIDLRSQSEYRMHVDVAPVTRSLTLEVLNEVPARVSGVQVIPSTDSFTISWDSDALAEDVSRILFEYGTLPGELEQEIEALPDALLEVADLVAGGTYYYRLAAVDRSGLQGEPTEVATIQLLKILPGDVTENGWFDYLDLFLLVDRWHDLTLENDVDGNRIFQEEDLLDMISRWGP